MITIGMGLYVLLLISLSIRLSSLWLLLAEFRLGGVLDMFSFLQPNTLRPFSCCSGFFISASAPCNIEVVEGIKGFCHIKKENYRDNVGNRIYSSFDCDSEKSILF
jgi:hypothetical protein